jgi:hypothetical protein
VHTVPAVGVDTLFASQTAAYDAPSPRLQASLDGLMREMPELMLSRSNSSHRK